MTVESFSIAPGSDSDTTSIPQFEIPAGLTRDALVASQRLSGSDSREMQILWAERGRGVERKVKSIIESQTDIVSFVDINPEGTEGSDLIVNFIEGFAINNVQIEVKSSNLGIRDKKHKIREKIFIDENGGRPFDFKVPVDIQLRRQAVEKWNSQSQAEIESRISMWLTNHGVLLINGGKKDGVEKTKEEILRDSFYPQLTRLVEHILGAKTPDPKYQLLAFPGLTLLWHSQDIKKAA